MATGGNIEVRFMEGGKPFSQRAWSAVPRVGDYVRLGPSNSETVFSVSAVTWDENADGAQQAIVSINRVA